MSNCANGDFFWAQLLGFTTQNFQKMWFEMWGSFGGSHLKRDLRWNFKSWGGKWLSHPKIVHSDDIVWSLSECFSENPTAKFAVA